MASNSETGHAKNVANFEDLTSFCTGYGASYNPVKASIKLAALGTLRTTALGTLTTVTTGNTAFINSTNTRQLVFAPIKALATRIVNALAATDASDQLIEDAKTINRKIQGARKGGGTKPPTPPVDGTPPPDDNQISVSQQSYDSLIENFKKLIELVGSEPTYTPNEVELQVATLATQAADLSTKNTAVINATTDLSNARINRNKILYLKDSGLVDVAGEVKKYVKSVFGATSPEYKQVSKIKFTKPR
jgi:hypothetical protein